MIKLLKHAKIYAPAPMGVQDVLVVGEKICRIAPVIEGYEGLPEVEVFDLEGRILAPAIWISTSISPAAAGNKARLPACLRASSACLWRMALRRWWGCWVLMVSRAALKIWCKARALTEDYRLRLDQRLWLSADYHDRSVEKDIMMVPPIIGVKVAVSDHRSFQPTGEELIRLATAARRAGLLSCNPGLVTMHMGSGQGGLDPVFYVLDHATCRRKTCCPPICTGPRVCWSRACSWCGGAAISISLPAAWPGAGRGG